MTAPEAMEPRRARSDERSRVVTTLCRAFLDDPVYRWLVPDEARRRRSQALFYAHFVEACWPHGGVYVAGGGAGAALWIPPRKQLIADDRAETFNRELLECAGDEAASARMAQLLQLLGENHPTEDCWYLAFMGVDPSAHGQGIGTRLLSVVLGQADRDQVPAYLEASSPENQRLYERHGFVTVRELSVADSPALSAMWRTPTGTR